MMQTLLTLAALLKMPTQALKKAAHRHADALHDAGDLSAQMLAEIDAVLGALERRSLPELRALHEAAFDKDAGTSLHLGDHMAEGAGAAMPLSAAPLPELLEALALQPCADRRPLLRALAQTLRPVEARMEVRGTPYAALLAALRELAGSARSDTPAAHATPAPGAGRPLPTSLSA